MLLKTPKFWLQKNFIAYALWPLSLVYLGCTKIIKFLQSPQKCRKPIICVGNLTMGGSGKTPVALALGKILREMNINCAYLSKGYGGHSDLVFVNEKSTARMVGDEPLLLAEIAPTFIAKNYICGAQEIVRNNIAQLIIMDDGMQNNLLKKDFLIVVIDGQIKFGNNFLFPAGPLRESVYKGLSKADLIIVLGKINQNLRDIFQNINQEFQKNYPNSANNIFDKKIIQANLKTKNLTNFSNQKLIAFCGLAYPQKFFSYLENQGLKLANSYEFPDHYFYKISELEHLLQQAKMQNAKLITTKKDWIKFPRNFQKQIDYLEVELEFEDKNLLIEKLRQLW